jgi:hypothetical protein
MPAGASAYASARFQRPSVWARRCPHVVDALDRDGDRCRDERRFVRATALYDGALGRDPLDWHARFERARIEVASSERGDREKGRGELAQIASEERAPRTFRDRAEDALADDDLARGNGEQAVQTYRRLAARALDEDIRRTMEVKAQALDGPAARQALVDLLVGEPGRPLDPWIGGLSLGAWAEETADPLAAYLVGRNLANHERYARAGAWLDQALAARARGAPVIPSVARELLRQRAICACALGDRPALARVGQLVAADDSPYVQSAGTGRKEWVLRLMARCATQ